MTSIDTTPNRRRKAGVKGQKKERLKIDMTPMVDLGFLLITFFIITAELSRPTTTSLNMPKDGPPMPVGNSSALSIILAGDDRVFYYRGNWEDAIKRNEIIRADLSSNSLRNAIIEQKHQLDLNDNADDGLMLLIKSTGDASYKNIVDMLDEALINDVKKICYRKTGIRRISLGKRSFVEFANLQMCGCANLKRMFLLKNEH
jgi:biopolymer transport protein ExbD